MRFSPWRWAGYRVVVIDVETAADELEEAATAGEDPAESFRVVEIAAVSLSGPRLSSTWATPVRPPIAVDPTSFAIHHISDDDLESAATFADIEHTLSGLLTPAENEQVIIVAHKASFDIPILRAEYRRLGLEIPDLPVIDTLDELPRFVGLERSGRSLAATCSALKVPHSNAHTALGDATATAEVFKKLLDYCLPEGVTNFDDLLVHLNGETTLTVSPDLPDLSERPFGVPATLTPEHRATHNVRFDPKTAEEWIEGSRNCVESACWLLSDKYRVAFGGETPPLNDLEQVAILNRLLDHATSLEAGSDTDAAGAGFATALGAFAPLVQRLPSRSEKANSPFTAIKKWGNKWGAAATRYGPCDKVKCPDCAAGRNCPNELWPRWLANRLFTIRLRTYQPETGDNKSHFANIVQRSNPKNRTLPASFPALLKAGLPEVADELLEMAARRLEQDQFHTRAEAMRTEAWEYHDGRGPNLARWRAARQSGSNLPGAIRTCRQTLDRDDCPPSPARRLLVTDLRRYQRLLVQQERRTLLDPANPSGRAALSRIQPARPNRSLFGLDDLVGSELSRDSAHPTTRG